MKLTYIYFIISIFALLLGLMDSTLHYSKPCEKPWTRLQYIFPSYNLGCWLGDMPESKK